MLRVAPATPTKLERHGAILRLPGPRVYLAAIVLFAAMIGSLEAAFRIRGFVPSVPDSARLWAYHRSQVAGDDARLVVAIGTSRVRTDLRSDVFHECLPSHRFVQLGVNGGASPLDLLAEISRIPRFCGLVLCDILPPLMDPHQSGEQSPLARVPSDKVQSLSAYLQGLLSERLAVLNPAVTLRQYVSAQGVLRPKPDGPRLRVHADRTLDITYASPESLKASTDGRLRYYADLYAKAKRYQSIDEFKQAVAGVADSVARIQRNGGQVVFLRLPASGARLELEESAFPSPVYFSAFASVTSAPWIDFRNLSGNEAFDCPDESHLSLQGARVFTARLVDVLRLRALLIQPGVPRAENLPRAYAKDGKVGP
jgi:hypothetical protein